MFSGRPETFGADNRIADPGFGYDARGNLVLLPTGERYVYDGENRQVVYCASFVSEADCNNPAVTIGKTFYYYDGEGRRVGKVSGAVTEAYVYDARGRLAAEYGGLAVETATHYLTADHLGSTRVITDPSKAVILCKDYLPFGDEVLANTQNGRSSISCYSAETGLRQKFTGKERDPESRLDFFEARYYSWAQGRFTSADEPLVDQEPEDPQSWNLYHYVRNNPLRFSDPTGRACVVRNNGSQYDDERPGQTCAEVEEADKNLQPSITVGINSDEARLMMLQTVGERLSSPHQWAVIASEAGQTALAIESGRALLSGLSALRNVPAVRWNNFKGVFLGENAVYVLLRAKGYRIVGRNVTARTSLGGRRIDFLVKSPSGELVAIEVKTGSGFREAAQLAKDREMEMIGARLVGKKAGDYAGEFRKIRTEVWNPF